MPLHRLNRGNQLVRCGDRRGATRRGEHAGRRQGRRGSDCRAGCARGSDGIGDRDVAGCLLTSSRGKAGGLHWVAAGAVAAEATAGAKVTPIRTSEPRAVPAATVARSQRGTTAALNGALEWMASPVRPRLMRSERRQELRKRCNDDDQADSTVGPPLENPEINNRLRRTFEVCGIIL